MRPNRETREAPWMSDARLRRAITEQIKQRRAKRKRALDAFEQAIRSADQRQSQLTER